MRDLTRGSITGHILAMAAPMAVGMLVQTLYFMVDLYFVSRLGDAAIAGVAAAGNFAFAVMALTQMLGVGTVALIAHAVGAGDRRGANDIFNQSLALAALCALLTLAGGLGLAGPYMQAVAADAATAAAGTRYLAAYVPGLALQFAMVVMGSALRGTGLAQPAMVAQLATVVVNIVLAPVLIAGLGTGLPLGVAGAGLASSIAVAAGTLLLATYFVRLEHYVGFERAAWRPRLHSWRRILDIGLPAGGEFALMFVYMAVIYSIIAGFGAAAQAGFGIGSRIMQAVFLPPMAVAFAMAPVGGQNYGARSAARVRQTFRDGALICCVLMALVTLFCQWRADALVGFFTRDAAVLASGTLFLHVISWNFVGSGLVFTCSGMFQAIGNTWPAVLSSATRLVTFVLPAAWIARHEGFRIESIWHVSVASVVMQALLSVWLLRRQLAVRLRFDT